MTLLATHNTGISSCGPSFEAYEIKAPLVTITCSQRAGKIKIAVSSVQQLEDVALVKYYGVLIRILSIGSKISD